MPVLNEMSGHPAVASVGTTPALVLVPPSVPLPGFPARSNIENHTFATVVRVAVLLNGMTCLADAM
jgi:hypothetical protein